MNTPSGSRRVIAVRLGLALVALYFVLAGLVGTQNGVSWGYFNWSVPIVRYR